MANTVKRLNYYDHQFLRAPDFTDEQNYHLSMRRLHNSALHTWGIVRGLDVSLGGSGTGTAVTVHAGVAIDSAGQEMVLPADTVLELGGEAAGTTLNITIAYDEQQSDPTTEAGGPGNTRITEMPKLSFSKDAPADKSMTLILGKVPRTATGLGPIDTSDRKQAGVVLGSDLTVNTVTLKKDGIAQPNWPVLSCGGANQASLANAGLNVNGNVGIGLGRVLRIEGGTSATDTADYFSFGGNGTFGIDAPAVPNGRFVVQNSGNVGLGLPNPDYNLTVFKTGANTGVYADLRNSNHEVLLGVDSVAILSAMTASDLEIRTGNVTRAVIAGDTGILTANSAVRLGNSDLYFTKTDHAHTGFGNTTGFAAIENDGSTYNALMILGRTTATGRSVKLWDKLQVNGSLEVTGSVVGKLLSPMWRATQVMNQRQGPLPITVPFASGGGTLVIIFSGSGYGLNSIGNIGMGLQIDGGTVATTRSFTNEQNSHKAFTTNILVQGNVAAGNHTIGLFVLTNTTTDGNDWFNITVLELPF